MSYIATAGILDDVKSVVGNAVSGAGAATKVLKDPNFPKVVKLVEQAYSVEAATSGSSASKGGSALGDLILPLEVYVETKKRPWLKIAIPALIIGLPIILGYQLGKRSR